MATSNLGNGIGISYGLYIVEKELVDSSRKEKFLVVIILIWLNRLGSSTVSGILRIMYEHTIQETV